MQRGGECDDWDLEIKAGFGVGPACVAVEDHGAGTQYVRYRVRPKCSAGGIILSLMLALLSAGAGLDGAWLICLVLGSGALVSIYQTIRNCGGACAVILQRISVDAVKTAADVLTAGLA